MTILEALTICPKDKLIGMLLSIHEALWDPDSDDPEKMSWSADTLDAIAEVFDTNQLHPCDLNNYEDDFGEEDIEDF